MSTSVKKEREKAVIQENLAAAASAAAELLKGFGTLSKVAYIATTELVESRVKAEAKVEGTDKASNISAQNDNNVLDVISSMSKVNPLLWKSQLEHIALLDLRDACVFSESGNTERSKSKFEEFAQAITHARSAGPISERTRSKILDTAQRYHQSVSFIHMALESNCRQKEQLVNIFIDAKVNPEFKLKTSDLAPLAIATKMQDAQLMQALLRGGAVKTIDVSSIDVSNASSAGNTQKYMNAWDAKAFLSKLATSSNKTSVGNLKP